MKFAVLAENRTDAAVIVKIIKRILGRNRLSILEKGFGGSGHLRNNAGRQINAFLKQDATHFIICHDSDGAPPDQVRSKIKNRIKEQVQTGNFVYVIVVPVQEIEAWLIANPAASPKFFRS